MQQSPKQLNDMLLKDLSAIKLQQLSMIFILSHINNSMVMQELYMTSLVNT